MCGYRYLRCSCHEMSPERGRRKANFVPSLSFAGPFDSIFIHRFSRFTLEISPIFFRFFLKAGFFNKDSGPPSSEGGSYNFVRCQLWYPDTFGASLFQFFGLLSDRPQSRSPSAPGNRRRSVSHRPANLPSSGHSRQLDEWAVTDIVDQQLNRRLDPILSAIKGLRADIR